MKSAIIGFGAVACIAGAAVGMHFYRVGEMRSPAIKSLNDPMSAVFQSEKYDGSWVWPQGVLCGEVNAKNGYGAYTGFKRFITTPNGAAYVAGHGRVSTEARSGQEVLDELNVHTEVLKAATQAIRESGGEVTYSKDQIEQLVQDKIFDRRWQELCS